MPLPNGVDPVGVIHPVCPSAGWMGNRGLLHDDAARIARAWRLKAWITCRLSYKGWSRQPLMKPGRYTELFFLDEATALSAGHRPCAMCRRADYLAFKSHWLTANGFDADMLAAELDGRLHEERIHRGASDAWRHPLAALPAGVMVSWNDVACLWDGTALRAWSSTGYGEKRLPDDPRTAVNLLTPPSIVDTIRHGYHVQLHASATNG
ncbi:hypothetical protein [Paraburkholderia azotifigens]|uniref:Uncharacterized protein n=1 Tax=Paraburkholderia azotifigens TaxID=2057004 RepID=A0A5C6VUJ8_9BURK|nr:hypothetical protein [Paraburkholderia azotifigens]TXC89033.1 hypothetical protein FRZ40_16530 [Paraburkholderia azotifigens]